MLNLVTREVACCVPPPEHIRLTEREGGGARRLVKCHPKSSMTSMSHSGHMVDDKLWLINLHDDDGPKTCGRDVGSVSSVGEYHNLLLFCVDEEE